MLHLKSHKVFCARETLPLISFSQHISVDSISLLYILFNLFRHFEPHFERLSLGNQNQQLEVRFSTLSHILFHLFFTLAVLLELNSAVKRYVRTAPSCMIINSDLKLSQLLFFIYPWLLFRVVSCLMQLQYDERVFLDSYSSPPLSQAWKSREPWVGELQFAIPRSFRGSDPKIDPA